MGEAGEEAREASAEEGTIDVGAVGAGRRDVDAMGKVCAGSGRRRRRRRETPAKTQR